ncbi:DNA polymerase III subunit beta [Nostoc sp. DedQUE07]|uniref:DNA polymerase III subunit beta n=1 Tax=Nostoc sp. DedQUE07 TaxID=3075392 RepID=UPI002AD47C53|nr:DNA polymerase III subunit beta [Nostoc sp. DedQUE07]MDZ8131877.1 DNA polymerase III subunit beta [Nostoc sp. DedQUE07]
MTATSVTPVFAVGDKVEILRSQNTKDTNYNGTVAEITGFSTKGWLKLKCHDGKSATLKPDWVSLKQSAPVETEAEVDEVEAPVVEAEAEAAEVVIAAEPVSDEVQSKTPPEPEVATEDKSIGYFKFSCNSALFAKTIAQVRRVIRTMSIHPILSNVKITADAETRRVEMVGFDLSLGVITSFLATEVPVGGSYTIAVSILSDILSQLPEGTITLERNESSPKAKLTTANGVFEISGIDAYDFPALPIPTTNVTTLKVTSKLLRVGCGSTLYATSTDQTKMVLCGAHMVFRPEGKFEIAATDGHRLALYRADINSATNIETDQHLTVPARSLHEVERYLAKDEAMIEISYESSNSSGPSIVQFKLEEATIVTRLLEGDYPKYNELIPKKFQREIWVERLPLIGSIGRLAVLAALKTYLVKISVEAKKITLYSEDDDTGSGTEAIPAEVSGEDIKIAFNIKYISEALKSIATQEVAIKVNGPATPVICTPLNGYDIVALIMPVQLRS